MAAGSRVGIEATPRPDDAEVIVARGGKPFPPADADRLRKNAYLRVELEAGPEPGKLTKFRTDHVTHALGAKGWPDAYDAWTVGNARDLVLSVPYRDEKGASISACELASAPTQSAVLAEVAKRLKTYVTDSVKSQLYLAPGHDPVFTDTRPRLVVKNGVTFKGTPDKLVVESREGVGVVCPIAKSTPLVFTSPDGKSSVATYSFAPANVGDLDIYVSAPSGTVEPGWELRYQTADEIAASQIAAFAKIRATFEAAWGQFAAKSKVRWTWIAPYDLGYGFKAYYPGDAAVDVLGVDAMNPWNTLPNAPWLEFADLLAGVRAFAAERGGKDVLVASTGSLDGFVMETTGATSTGVGATVPVPPMASAVDPKSSVYFFDAAGKLLAETQLAEVVLPGATTLVVADLAEALPPKTAVLVRAEYRSGARWVENARSFLKDCAPEVKGVVWRTGGPSGFWLDQGPAAAPDVIEAFGAWANDPYFGG